MSLDTPRADRVTAVILATLGFGNHSEGDLLDKSLRHGLTLSHGDISLFFTRLISATFVLIIVFSIILSIPYVRKEISKPLIWILGNFKSKSVGDK